MRAPPIYVEIPIAGAMDDLWEKTQNPVLHQRWDLRFSVIEYLPRQPGEPQRFLYATRIGAGLRIEGAGESTGTHDDTSGERTSALKFWSDDTKSLIETGSGYWKYIPRGGSVRFLTWYDYRTRFGVMGHVVDGLFFRPLISWATAWSFDRLRLWIEKGIAPEESRDRMLVHALARMAVALVWFYQGLVPKLLFPSADEVAMMLAAGVSERVLTPLGGLEMALGAAVALFWRRSWPLWLTVAAMLAATGTVALIAPQYLAGAFNAVTLNLSVAALAGVALLTRANLPSASRCLRRPAEGGA
jgi:hypothetical protein